MESVATSELQAPVINTKRELGKKLPEMTIRQIAEKVIDIREEGSREIYGEDKEKTRALKGLFREFQRDPHLLLDLPDFPETLDPNNLNLKQLDWFKKLGLEGREDLILGEISDEEYFQVINPNSKLQDMITDKIGGSFTTTSFVNFLEIHKALFEQEIYAAELLISANEIIEKYLPNLKPQSPTEIHIREGESEAPAGAYLGTIDGTYHIEVAGSRPETYGDAVKNPLVDKSAAYMAVDTVVAVHELIHQSHAERSASRKLNNAGNPSSLEPVEDKNSNEVLISDVPSEDINTKSLFLPVVEGVATLAELYVINQMVADSTDPEIQKKLTELKTARLNSLRDSAKAQKKLNDPSLHTPGIFYYEGTVGLIRGIYKRFGVENLPAILEVLMRKADLEECDRIQRGDERFSEILNDPTKLPGIDIKDFKKRF